MAFYIHNRAKLPEHPLAMYIFTQDKAFEQALITNVRCGVGDSGAGSYHGKHTFDLFSHHKSVLRSATWLDPKLRYVPYGNKAAILKKASNWL